jgi:hypothetical protein
VGKWVLISGIIVAIIEMDSTVVYISLDSFSILFSTFQHNYDADNYYPNNNQFFFNSFYIAISYKDNDFIPSTDIYSKVNITMAIYVRRHFRRNDYMGEVGEEFHRPE